MEYRRESCQGSGFEVQVTRFEVEIGACHSEHRTQHFELKPLEPSNLSLLALKEFEGIPLVTWCVKAETGDTGNPGEMKIIC